MRTIVTLTLAAFAAGLLSACTVETGSGFDRALTQDHLKRSVGRDD